MLNKKTIKKIDKITDVLGRAMIFTVIIVLAAEFIVIGIFGFKIFYASAQTAPALKAVDSANVPQLALPVGDFNSSASFDAQHPENWIGQYVQAWFNYLVGAIGIIAVVMVMWGGIKWITSGGSSGQIEEAKGKIKNAVIGIILLLGAYTIFKTINPQLLNLSLPPIDKVVEPIENCCQNIATKAIFTPRFSDCIKDVEIKLPDMTECNKSQTDRVEQVKKSRCPPDTAVISTSNNDYTFFMRQVYNYCGVKNGTDANEMSSKIDMSKLSSNLENYEGSYFGCYACKQVQIINTNNGIPSCKWVNFCIDDTPIEYPREQGLCPDADKLENQSQKCCCEATISEETQIKDYLKSFGIKFNYDNACLPGQTSGCTSVAGAKKATVDEMIFLAQQAGPGNVIITGCTEDGHSSLHTLGNKFDTSKTAQVTNYVEKNAKSTHYWSDGTKVYVMADGAEYAEETDHWDVCVNCASG